MAVWYKPAVEHYLRLGIREIEPTNPVTKKWKDTVHKWLASLPAPDRVFIRIVFDSDNSYSLKSVMPTLPGKEGDNWHRLNALEKAFAQFAEMM